MKIKIDKAQGQGQKGNGTRKNGQIKIALRGEECMGR